VTPLQTKGGSGTIAIAARSIDQWARWVRSVLELVLAVQKGKWMRCGNVPLLFLLGAFSTTVVAQPAGPYVRAISSHLVIESFDSLTWETQCPAGYLPLGYTIIRGHDYDEDEVQVYDLVDANAVPVSRDSVSSATQITGGGFAVSMFNLEHHLKDFQVLATCLATSASADNSVTLNSAASTAAPGQIASVISFCGPESPVALAGFSNADYVGLQDAGLSPVWGTSFQPGVADRCS
jgi:hypothetical protein